MYEIIFSPGAKKQFLKLDKEQQKRVSAGLSRLRFNPERHVRKLVGRKGYRLRVGKLRIILDIKKKKLHILVIKIGPRKNVYNI